MSRIHPIGLTIERTLRPHDLVRVVNLGSLVFRQQAPEWVRAAIQRAPYVVIRRARSDNGLLPVGIRGVARKERFAAWIQENSIQGVVRPEDLAVRRSWENSPRITRCSLDLVNRLFREFSWGPTGSVGFELASGAAVITSESDLDILVRVPERLALNHARQLHAALMAAPMRVDVQLETPVGAIALSEYAHRSNQILARTLDGPRLVSDPWSYSC
jgi:phosphoribosyl-dephospho-CoA transferase